MSPRVVALRRYPVKAMGGEALESVDVDMRGLVGDRWFAVADDDGRFASGKTTRRFRRHDEVFDYRAHTTAAGDVAVRRDESQWRVGTRELDADLSAALGLTVRVQAERGVPHQDAGSVSLISTATLHWCQRQLGVDADPRRLRANIVVSGDEPFIEESWMGQPLAIGGCALRIVARIQRCRIIDIAQDGVEPNRPWLKPLAAQRAMNLAVYADVLTPGRVSVGDTVRPGMSLDGAPAAGSRPTP